MVKQAFTDTDFKEKYKFTSANSINIARWLSQQFYYFYAIKQWPLTQPPVISVPSGNFGNLCAGLMAFKSGLSIDSFIAACNENDSFTDYLESGEFHEREAIQTVSNAMDVGNPSNFKRVLEVFDQDFDTIKKCIHSYSFSSAETIEAIEQVFKEQEYIMDPHGAVGYLALKKYLSTHPGKAGIFLETAHPSKFYDIVKPIAGEKLEIPDGAKHLFEKKQESIFLPANYTALKEALLN
jgi:threonine synthase